MRCAPLPLPSPAANGHVPSSLHLPIIAPQPPTLHAHAIMLLDVPLQEGAGGSSVSALSAPKAGSYVPPSLRNRGPGATMGDSRGGGGDQRREENSVRVTNLSDDVSEQDLAVSRGQLGVSPMRP